MEKQRKKNLVQTFLQFFQTVKEVNWVLLKSHFYLYWAKFSMSINVQISQHSKPAENMTHPWDIFVDSGVPLVKTRLQDGKEQIANFKYPWPL